MAIVNENLLVRGARGNVGKQYVYKKRGNDTHIARMPRINKNAKITDKQVSIRELFTQASLYAQGAISNPDLKKLYLQKAPAGTTAFNMAFRDFLKAPVVKKIDTGTYNGSIGSTIVITAIDDFRVADVTVSIHTAAGALLETGKAVLNPIDRSKFIYTASLANAVLAGSKISAVATDLPGNKGSLEITI